MDDAIIIVWFCLAVADSGMPRTIYHDRIDGLLLTACEPLPFACFWPI